ncbi:AMP-binding enzyme, putative [Angomonas deanei]|uniref:AMP-binding enzyme, putative n=1 Tax=Angomonas deanei TaxID=59799 RepID=A0A7G2CMY3_9TRYP|nr:AMP-binding enzyme, putative [Angomonas deanei]
MGGAVVSLMEARNYYSMTVNPEAEKFRARLDKHGGSFARYLPGTETKNTSATFVLADRSDEERVAFGERSYSQPCFYRLFQDYCKANPDKQSLGYRPVERVVKEDITDATGKTKKMDITYCGPTVRLPLSSVWEKVEYFGRGLLQIGATPRSNVAIFMDTSLEWLVSIYGIWSQDMVTATVYANLGHDALAYALHETGSAAVVCNGENAAKIAELIRSGEILALPIIYSGNLPDGFDGKGLELHKFEDILEMGRESHVPSPGPVSNDDLALIMYTSGTTGDPKGVMHTHGSILAGGTFLEERVTDLVGPLREGDTYCAFLPMAHVMEFTVTNVFLMKGYFVGFGGPRTLTDVTCRPHGDLTEFKPTFAVAVPRIFDTMKKAIEAKLPPPGSVKRAVFDQAFATRLKALRDGYETPFYNEKVFATSRAIFGGRVRTFLSGGGPTSAETQNFANVCFGQVVGGYGMTETVCVGGVQIPGDFEPCTTGLLVPGMEYKLLDTDHYKHTDTPDPRGELLQRGRHLFKGYYKQPELTKEAIDEDGWFHTGDVASLSKDGKLKLVGRVKALAKNVMGEYVALENLEAIYGNNPLLLPNGVCVLVNPHRSYICAIGLTEEAKAVAFAAEHGIAGEYPAILEDPAFQKAAARSLAETAKKAKRAGFEQVRNVAILNDVWTAENDVLTAAMKLKRRVIDEKYADVIEKLFAEP